ncbi:MAG: DUF1934 domain-containing protein [Lachnospiraceae bacterium]|nr:DUF1934 domain-containing protein [Lachnospiraceae bacterium]
MTKDVLVSIKGLHSAVPREAHEDGRSDLSSPSGRDIRMSEAKGHSRSSEARGHSRGSDRNTNENVAPEDAVEVFSPGKYYFRNGKHYVEYEEPDDNTGEVIKTRITLRDRHLEVIRKGSVSTKMVFEENRKNTSWYNTVAGSILTGFDVGKMQVTESEEQIEILVDYTLEMNYEPVAACSIRIRILAHGTVPSLRE